jgi:hypothetical protein
MFEIVLFRIAGFPQRKGAGKLQNKGRMDLMVKEEV